MASSSDIRNDDDEITVRSNEHNKHRVVPYVLFVVGIISLMLHRRGILDDLGSFLGLTLSAEKQMKN